MTLEQRQEASVAHLEAPCDILDQHRTQQEDLRMLRFKLDQQEKQLQFYQQQCHLLGAENSRLRRESRASRTSAIYHPGRVAGESLKQPNGEPPHDQCNPTTPSAPLPTAATPFGTNLVLPALRRSNLTLKPRLAPLSHLESGKSPRTMIFPRDLLVSAGGNDEASLLLSLQSTSNGTSVHSTPIKHTGSPSLESAIDRALAVPPRAVLAIDTRTIRESNPPSSATLSVANDDLGSAPAKRLKFNDFLSGSFGAQKTIACHGCHSKHPFGFWIRDHSRVGAFICQKCYALQSPKYCDLIVESAVVTRCESCYSLSTQGISPIEDCKDCARIAASGPSYVCNSCSRDTSAGSWYSDRNSGALCQKCYHTKHRIRIDTLPDGMIVQRTCMSCVNFKSSSWYRDTQVQGAYHCKQCYNHRYQAKVDNHLDKDGNPRIYPAQPGKYLCKRCYHQQDRFKMVLKPDGTLGLRECSVCNAKDSSRWYKDVGKPGCYVDTNLLLLLSHPPTFTVGRSIKENTEGSAELAAKLKEKGAEYIYSKRGGKITFHGPGQLVGYPILNLRDFRLGVREYVARLEALIGDVCLNDFGVATQTSSDTGVWVGGTRKIAALGIQVQRHVTSHGFALNCNTDLAWFDHIVPCGLADKTATSLTLELSRNVGVEDVLPKLIWAFGKQFNADMVLLHDHEPRLDEMIDKAIS
ncbi:hypothetical protein HDV03_004762 [Kappamyces sp. JEL0829]|nr:hypothetical protein HDV03_004762 [Kappamyces sp. JEL0829]